MDFQTLYYEETEKEENNNVKHGNIIIIYNTIQQ